MLYSAFGLSLEANRPIPGLASHRSTSRPDVRVCFQDNPSHSPAAGTEEPYFVSTAGGDGPPALQVWKSASRQYFRLRYADDTQFLVALNGSEVRAFVPAASTVEDTATYLLGPILGFVLRLRGITCLHASVVVIGGRAIAIAGPAGAGKSTTAAALASMGHAVLADDIAALNFHHGTVQVQPAYPQLRLWPDSVAMLYGSADALAPLTPTWDKRALPLAACGAFQSQPLPLAAIYVLDAYGNQRQRDVDALTGIDRLLTLLANTYVGYLLDATMRRQEFDCLVRLAATIPVRQVRRSGEPGPVGVVCEHLIEDVKGLDVQHH